MRPKSKNDKRNKPYDHGWLLESSGAGTTSTKIKASKSKPRSFSDIFREDVQNGFHLPPSDDNFEFNPESCRIRVNGVVYTPELINNKTMGATRTTADESSELSETNKVKRRLSVYRRDEDQTWPEFDPPENQEPLGDSSVQHLMSYEIVRNSLSAQEVMKMAKARPSPF